MLIFIIKIHRKKLFPEEKKEIVIFNYLYNNNKNNFVLILSIKKGNHKINYYH